MMKLVTGIVFAGLMTSIVGAQEAPKQHAAAAAKPASAVAQAGEAVPLQPQAPDWTPLKLLMGAAQCAGTLALGGQPRPIKTTVTGTTVLNNVVFSVTCKERQSKQVPIPFQFQAFGTYDAGARVFNFAGVDNLGGFEVGQTKGLEGDRIVLEATMTSLGHKMPIREVIESKSPKAYRWIGETTMHDKPMLLWDWTCTKK